MVRPRMPLLPSKAPTRRPRAPRCPPPLDPRTRPHRGLSGHIERYRNSPGSSVPEGKWSQSELPWPVGSLTRGNSPWLSLLWSRMDLLPMTQTHKSVTSKRVRPVSCELWPAAVSNTIAFIMASYMPSSKSGWTRFQCNCRFSTSSNNQLKSVQNNNLSFAEGGRLEVSPSSESFKADFEQETMFQTKG